MSSRHCGSANPSDPEETCLIRMAEGDTSMHALHLGTRTSWPNTDPQVQQAVANLQNPPSKKRQKSAHQQLLVLGAAGVRERRERFTKETGMAAAYSAQVEPRENFERLLYYICRTTDPMHVEGVISSDNVWRLWREMDWPEPESRQFVGNAMKTAADTYGWIEPVGQAQNTSGNGHSRDPNRTYVSKVYGPDGADAVRPDYEATG